MTDEYQIDNVTWAEKDGDGNIVVDSDVVNTEKETVAGDTTELIDTYTQPDNTTSTVTVSFSGLSPEIGYEIRLLYANPRSSGTLNWTVNNDDSAGNGNYTYYDETGTNQTGVDKVELVDYGSFSGIYGSLYKPKIPNGPTNSAIQNELVSGVGPEINGFADWGSWSGNNVIDSMQFEFTGGLSDGNKIELRSYQ